MSRIYNFSSGPAMLPDEVMAQAQREFRDCQGSGVSAMEMSHRGADFQAIARRAERSLRTLLGVPDNYRILFLQGGASAQFAMVPLNLLRDGQRAAYVNTGYWSAKAIEEARRFGTIDVVADGAASGYTAIPPRETWQLDRDAAYLHYTPNETIGGVEFHWIPETDGIPLVADMSSTLLSRPLDVSRFALIYAGAQKNIGPAGLTVVILREDLARGVPARVPTLYDYAAHIKAESMINTPPTYAWYMAGLVFDWIARQGGLAAMAERNRRKSGKLYAFIDASGFYRNRVTPECRSWMNVPFTLADARLERDFLEEARHAGLVNLEGHRSVGGMRASLYNAMPEEGVDALIAFMRDFERRHG